MIGLFPIERLPQRFNFRRHAGIYVGATATVLTAEAVGGVDWPLFWPLGIWAGIVGIHFLVASAYEPDQTWVDERIAEVKSRSYDFDHIRNIEQRIEDKDASITPPTERAPKQR